MADNLRHLQMMDVFKERIDDFIRAQIDKLSFDKAQYDIDLSKDEAGHTTYTINLQITDYGHQLIRLTPKDHEFSLHVQVLKKGIKTLPQHLISLFHEELLGEYLDNSESEGNVVDGHTVV